MATEATEITEDGRRVSSILMIPSVNSVLSVA